MHEPIREIARFYASHFGDSDTLRILDAGRVQDEDRSATALLRDDSRW
jgi:hypothetical protein